jgi:hypothetical protein
LADFGVATAQVSDSAVVGSPYWSKFTIYSHLP